MIVTSAAGDSFDVIQPEETGAELTEAAAPAEGRSPGWRKVERAAVEAHPCCSACGGKKDLQVHHVLPFHLHPDLELEPSNLIVLCRVHHLWVGHLGDWKSWNAEVRADAAAFLKKVGVRPYPL